MKKLIVLLLAVVFVSVSVVGCGETKSTGGGKGGTTTPPGDKKTTP